MDVIKLSKKVRLKNGSIESFEQLFQFQCEMVNDSTFDAKAWITSNEVPKLISIFIMIFMLKHTNKLLLFPKKNLNRTFPINNTAFQVTIRMHWAYDFLIYFPFIKISLHSNLSIVILFSLIVFIKAN